MTLNPATLRPLSMGQILDRAVYIYRHNFLSFVGIIAVTQIPLTVVSLFLGILTLDVNTTAFDNITENFGLFGVGAGVSAVVGLILTQVATAAVTLSIANSYLGQPTTIFQAYRLIGRSWLTLLLALIVGFFVSVLALAWWIFVPFLGWFTGLGILLFMYLVIVPMIAPVIVLERHRAGSAWRRAWELTRHRFWWVFGFSILLFVFSQVVVTIPSVALQLLLTFTFGDVVNPILATVITQLTQLIGNLIYLPLFLTAITLLYFDLRIRHEGFDIAVMAASPQATPDLTIMRQAPTAPDNRLIAWREMGYFALVTLAIFGLYIGLIGLLAVVALSLAPSF